MRIAFAIVSLFPGGGLQRDCVEIAKLVRHQGHEVVIHTCRLHDFALAGDIPILLLQNAAKTNHTRQLQFASNVLKETAGRYDLLVGFDKLLDLDVLYCADPSMAYRVMKSPPLQLLPRYRTYARIEKSSFAPDTKTKLILLSDNQTSEYRSAWQTELDRIVVIPPTLTLARRRPEERENGVRQALRSSLGLAADEWVWLSIGVQPDTKGFDRTLRALTKFPDAKLLIAGLNETNRASLNLVRRTGRVEVADRVKWLGHREDISQLMAAADVLVHPARYDTTGTVILEAVANGLPVITTAACGHARHVDAAGAGIVIREPFEFPLFIAALEHAQSPARRRIWSEAGAEYGKNPLLYQGHARAADAIIRAAQQKIYGLAQKFILASISIGSGAPQEALASLFTQV